MRHIVPSIPKEYISATGEPKHITTSTPIPVNSFRELVEIVAKFSYHNKDHLLFYRGQRSDYKNKAGGSSFYPNIYRDDYLQAREVSHRFDILEGASKALIDLFEDHKVEGRKDLKRRKLIQWSILQHYEVCLTPLLDFTHSLRVACSFACMNNPNDYAFVFAFGFPIHGLFYRAASEAVVQWRSHRNGSLPLRYVP